MVVAALVFLVGMTVGGAIIELGGAYRAHRRRQWSRRYVKQLKTTGLRRPVRKA